MTNQWGADSAADAGESGSTGAVDEGSDDDRPIEVVPPGLTTELSRLTDPTPTSDVDIDLLDSIEEELDEVEHTLARLDEDGS